MQEKNERELFHRDDLKESSIFSIFKHFYSFRYVGHLYVVHIFSLRKGQALEEKHDQSEQLLKIRREREKKHIIHKKRVTI
jgi:hypothetical protein